MQLRGERASRGCGKTNYVNLRGVSVFPFSTSGCIRRLHIINFQGGPHRQKSKDHFLFCPAPFHALCKRAAAALHKPAAVLERKAVRDGAVVPIRNIEITPESYQRSGSHLDFVTYNRRETLQRLTASLHKADQPGAKSLKFEFVLNFGRALRHYA